MTLALARPSVAVCAARIAATLLVGALAPRALAAQQADVGNSLDTTVALAPGGTVDLGLISGSITVAGWERPEARVRATTERGTLRFQASDGRVALEVRGTHVGDARYDLTVPAGTRLLMRGTSGTLTARGVSGEVSARTVSGDVEVTGAGRTTIESISGSVTARGVQGALRVSAVSGDLQLEAITGDVEASTVSGGIELQGVQSRLVRAETVSGDVTFAGTIDPAGRYDLTAASGDVTLSIPTGTSALLSVQTFSSEVQSNIPLTLQPGTSNSRIGPRRLEFRLGNGGARIAIESFNGDITIQAGNGRTPEETEP